MRVAELIAALENAEPDAEVRIAIQPSWPMQHYVESVVGIEPGALADAEKFPGVVYIGAGGQPSDDPYLPTAAAVELGWSEDHADEEEPMPVRTYTWSA
jgi:hypothetical protein